METFLEELRLLIKARYPLIYLVSYEEERVMRALKWLTGGQDERLSTWTATTGFESVTQVLSDAADPLKALEVVRLHEPRQLFVFKDFHPYFDEARISRRLRDLQPQLEEDQKTLIFVSSTLSIPRDLEKDIVVVDVPLPSLPEISKILAALLKAHNLTMGQELYEKILKASLGLTEREIKKVYAKILVSGSQFAERDLAMVISEKRKILRKSQFLEFVELGENLEDVGGMGQLKEWLMSRGQAFSERARQYGLPQPKGLFMLGVQGCGKSLTAKAVARLWQLPLLRLDLASMITAGSGSDQNLRDTIRIAESMAPTVLWIDEIEKAFGGLSGESGQHAASRVLGALLTWLQEKTKPVFVIATANDIQNLPPELLRKGRFDEIFFIDLPTVHDRVEVLQIHLRKRSRNPENFQLYEVAEVTEKFSGAELEQLVIAAMFYAFSRNREVATEDLLRTARETVPLAVTMDDAVKALKDWAQFRTRPAAHDTRRIDFFEEWEEAS